MKGLVNVIRTGALNETGYFTHNLLYKGKKLILRYQDKTYREKEVGGLVCTGSILDEEVGLGDFPLVDTCLDGRWICTLYSFFI